MALTTRSAKAKGRRFQQYIRDRILAFFSHLTSDDVRSLSMGAGGVDILLSAEAKRSFPYAIEAKNTERLNIWQAIQQAERNCGDEQPIVMFSRNRSKSYAVVELDHFLDLARRASYEE